MTDKQVSLPIVGMTCANCVSVVEKGLHKLDGVGSVDINLALERASVSFDPEKLSQQDLIDRVELVGYEVPEATTELAITGMTCANCVSVVEKGLRKLDDVTGVSVNLATEKASVTYIPGQVTRQDLVKVVPGWNGEFGMTVTSPINCARSQGTNVGEGSSVGVGGAGVAVGLSAVFVGAGNSVAVGASVAGVSVGGTSVGIAVDVAATAISVS